MSSFQLDDALAQSFKEFGILEWIISSLLILLTLYTLYNLPSYLKDEIKKMKRPVTIHRCDYCKERIGIFQGVVRNRPEDGRNRLFHHSCYDKAIDLMYKGLWEKMDLEKSEYR
jgi:hypothetical protein